MFTFCNFLFIKAKIPINHSISGLWVLGMQNIATLILKGNKTGIGGICRYSASEY